MKRLLGPACLAVIALLAFSQSAMAQRAKYETLIAEHAQANLVPEDLVHRIIIRESKYQAQLLGSGGAIGLMQIKLSTARGLGYTGTAEGLRDPATNLMYGIKYLAGAFRAANGAYDRAVHYYAAGYYFAAKQQRLDHIKEAKAGPSTAAPKQLSRQEIAAAKAADKAADKDPEQAVSSDDSSARADATATADASADSSAAPPGK